MTTPTEILINICRAIPPGVRFPTWTVTTPSGHLAGLISDVPAGRGPVLQHVVRTATMTALGDAGLVTLGELEPVPEYEGVRPGLRWEPGRLGRRLVVTDAGRAVAGSELGDPGLVVWPDPVEE